jgi:hypothetical protein
MTLLHQIFNTETNSFELRPMPISGSVPALLNNSGETINQGDLVAVNQSEANSIIKADSSDLSTCEGIIGIASADITDGNNGEIGASGALLVNSEGPLLIGRRVYASSIPGFVSSVPPSTGVVFLVGIASDVDKVIFQPHLETVL